MLSFENYIQNYVITNNLYDNLTDIPKADLEDFLLENNILDAHKMLELKQQYYIVEGFNGKFNHCIILNNEAKNLCINHLMLPIRLVGNALEVVADNPFMLNEIESLRLLTSKKIICISEVA